MKKRIARGQIFFDFWYRFDDNKCTCVQQKTPCGCENSRTGAGHSGGSRPNGVIATPILPDPSLLGKGSTMSTCTAIVLASSITPFPFPLSSPVTLKIHDPDEARRQRGRAIASTCRIEERKPNLWIVPAQTGNGSYWVRTDNSPPTCTCEDFEKREQACKHIHAVRVLIDQRGNHAPVEPIAFSEAPAAPEPRRSPEAWRRRGRSDRSDRCMAQHELARRRG